MKTNNELVEHLIREGILKSKNVVTSFRSTDRKDFVGPQNLENAYLDIPLPIGYNQTISQPTTVAFMLELLNAQPGDSILDIGSGSGWTTALLSNIVGEEGNVLGLEKIDKLVHFGKDNIEKYKLKNAKIQRAGEDFGVVGSQFDKILVSASAEKIPKELIKQIKTGGYMVIPVKNSIIKVYKESEDSFSIKEYYGFMFVPLVK